MDFRIRVLNFDVFRNDSTLLLDNIKELSAIQIRP
jgi:hypothetical protein